MGRNAVILPEASVAIEVPFYDVDALEVVWHGHYVKYFEVARSALLDKIGYNYREMRESGFAWPVIELKMRYAKPARFGQNLTVRAHLMEYELRLKIGYLVVDTVSGERLTKGHTIQVAVDMISQEMRLASPKVLTDKLAALK